MALEMQCSVPVSWWRHKRSGAQWVGPSAIKSQEFLGGKNHCGLYIDGEDSGPHGVSPGSHFF